MLRMRTLEELSVKSGGVAGRGDGNKDAISIPGFKVGYLGMRRGDTLSA
jgi:hypothetical protein